MGRAVPVALWGWGTAPRPFPLLGCFGKLRIPLLPGSGYQSTGDGGSRCKVTVAINSNPNNYFCMGWQGEDCSSLPPLGFTCLADPGHCSSNSQPALCAFRQDL